jgi:hypothetical protein
VMTEGQIPHCLKLPARVGQPFGVSSRKRAGSIIHEDISLTAAA